MTLSLLLGIKISLIWLKVGRLWLLFLSRRGNLVPLLHLFLSKETRKPLCISIFRLQKVYFFLKSLKFVINFIIQRCLEAHWNPAIPAQSVLLPWSGTLPWFLCWCSPKFPLSLSLVMAIPAHCCLWSLGFPSGLSGDGHFSPAIFMITGKLQTGK